jgi:hypothetical protein
MSITTPEEDLLIENEQNKIAEFKRQLDAIAKSATSIEQLCSDIHEMDGVIIGNKIYRDPYSGWGGTIEVEGHRFYL